MFDRGRARCLGPAELPNPTNPTAGGIGSVAVWNPAAFAVTQTAIEGRPGHPSGGLPFRRDESGVVRLSKNGTARSKSGRAFLLPSHNRLKTSSIQVLTSIANCNSIITNCNMRLGEKIRYLREVEGTLRGLGRDLSQQETTRLIQKELKKSISQSYLSQIESGARPHLTNSTRLLLARFFKVHPGYLVDDPEGFQNELISDPELHHALLAVARHSDSRLCLVLLGEILENPGLAERLMEVLKPAHKAGRRS